MKINNIRNFAVFNKKQQNKAKVYFNTKESLNTFGVKDVSSSLLNAYNRVVSFCGKKKFVINDRLINAKANEVLRRNALPIEKEALYSINLSNANDVLVFYQIILADNQIRAEKGEKADEEVSLEKAKLLLANGITNSEQIKDFLNLTNNGYSNEVAIDILQHNVKTEDREKYRILSETLFDNERKLSKEEAITCLAYGIDVDRAQFFIDRLEQDYNGNKLNLFEAALCTIYFLTEAQINDFFDFKSKEIDYGGTEKYTLSTQEAVLLSKANFNEDRLKRYACHKTNIFQLEGVRQHGIFAEKHLITEYIITRVYAEENSPLYFEDGELMYPKDDFSEFYEDFENFRMTNKKALNSPYKEPIAKIFTPLDSDELLAYEEIRTIFEKAKEILGNDLKNLIVGDPPKDNIHNNTKQFTQIQKKNYDELIGSGVKKLVAVAMAKDSKLSSMFQLIDKNAFWQISTGENQSVFNLFSSFLGGNVPNGTQLDSNDFSIFLPEGSSFADGILTDEKNGFCVDITKVGGNKNPVLIISNRNNEQEKYIAYDGAITMLKQLRSLDSSEKNKIFNDLYSHARLCSIETDAFASALQHFVIDLFEEDGKCIIGKGIKGVEGASVFNGEYLSTDETRDKFQTVLQELHNPNSSEKVSIENILRLIPRDAMLQIRPYATSSSEITKKRGKEDQHAILYSISSEWKDADGKMWELRVHSHDLKYIEKDLSKTPKRWIYRLGYQDNQDEKLFYNPQTNEFEEGNTNPETHVLIEEEPTIDNKKYTDYLISNPHFQKIIRDISISFNQTPFIREASKELCIDETGKNLEDIKQEIVSICEKSPAFYYKYKKLVDSLLAEKGFPPFSNRV